MRAESTTASSRSGGVSKLRVVKSNRSRSGHAFASRPLIAGRRQRVSSRRVMLDRSVTRSDT